MSIIKKSANNLKFLTGGTKSFLVILSIAIFWSVLTAAGLLQKFEYRVYDIMISLKKQPVENQDILLVDIDDLALDLMGEWPWTRDKIADSLLMMKELGAETAVFDIEYLSPSQKSINKNVIESIKSNPKNADKTIEKLFIDNDEYFAKTVQFFGNTWLTVNAGDISIEYSEDDLNYAIKRFLYPIEDVENSYEKTTNLRPYNEYSPALHQIIKHAKGAGFTNIVIDSDGTRRRVKLLLKYQDGALGQLAMAPLLNILKPEKIETFSKKIILHNCSIPGKEGLHTIKIPLDKEGNMLVNWLKKPFSATKEVQDENGETYSEIDDKNTSFKHNSIYYLWNLVQMEKEIADYLEYFNYTLKEFNISDLKKLLQNWNDIVEYKDFILSCMKGYDENGLAIDGGVNDQQFEEYFSLRQNFFAELNYLLDNENFAQALNSEKIFTNQEIMDSVNDFSDLIETFTYYYTEMSDIYQGKFCIIGNAGSGTTDLGTTPFNKQYPNVGTHANVYNTIMNQDFITPLAWEDSVIITFILSIFAFCFHSRRKIRFQVISGLGLMLLVTVVSELLMISLKIYVPVLTSLLIATTDFFAITIIRFRDAEKDKKFITNAFSQCLSKDVVAEIIRDPSKLALGGKNFNMTAIFTDIQKFSGFSELLSADELVQLLNYYLTRMSEIIIAEHGTVDKYEGDAIVAFMGAPVQMDNHAIKACNAALKMKAAEKQINQEILQVVQSGSCPANIDPVLFRAFNIMVNNKRTIFTRIGINSGSIVAGFMGSQNKKNYTVMGNNVNLASRLEGVNKQYHTNGILISEATQKLLDNSFIVRSLDRVQVVNVKTPIRLYELLAFTDEVDENYRKYVAAWEQTMKVFESGRYSQALEQFTKLSAIKPEDNVCKYYIELLKKFFIQGKYPRPQDDFGVAYNAENPEDMDKSWIGTKKEIKGTFTLLQK